MSVPTRTAAVAAALALVTVCAGGCRDGRSATLTAGQPAGEVTTAPPQDVAAASATAPTTAATAITATTAVAATPAPRKVHEQQWVPFAEVASVTLLHPSSRVEMIGYHQSNLDGARQLEPVATSAPFTVLEGRNRDTGNRTAADIVVDPSVEIRAPVTGTVRYAGTYVLYCKYSDDFLVIEPDSRPGWEVKILHIDGVRVRPGARVVAGQTVIAPRATVLPFASQVEEMASAPPWPHVHIEVNDPTIPDRPGPGGGC